MEIFDVIYNFYHKVFSTISKTKLFDWLYLDTVLHFLIGLILMLLLIKKVKSPLKSFLIILTIQLVKEIFDSFSLTASWKEALIDTAATMSYPALVIFMTHIKRKLS